METTLLKPWPKQELAICAEVMLCKPRLLALVLLIGVASSSPWNYNYRRDFKHWDWHCGEKGLQSPIDVRTNETKPLEKQGLRIRYDREYNVENCGWAVKQVNREDYWQVTFPHESPEAFCAKGPGFPHVEWRDKRFYLKEFHYHSPSEHTVDGNHTDMEVQHVHKADDGELLIIAVFVKVGHRNRYMGQFWNTFPKHQRGETTASIVPGWKNLLPYLSFMPFDKSYYYYVGSITRPPCTTHVNWILLQRPVYMSFEQLDAYRMGMSEDIERQRQVRFSRDLLYGVNPDWDYNLGSNNRRVHNRSAGAVFVYYAGLFGSEGILGTSFPWWFLLILICCIAFLWLFLFLSLYPRHVWEMQTGKLVQGRLQL